MNIVQLSFRATLSKQSAARFLAFQDGAKLHPTPLARQFSPTSINNVIIKLYTKKFRGII